MRQLPLMIAIVLGAFSILAMGQSAADEATTIRDMFFENINVEVHPIEEAALETVLHRPVYRVEHQVFPEDGYRGQEWEFIVFEGDDGLEQIFVPDTDEPLPYLSHLADPTFQLTEQTAPQFKATLQSLMPEGFFEEMDRETVRSRGGEWHFLTGTFFDRLKGFVVSVDEDGQVTDVSYSLSLSDEMDAS